MAIRPGRRPQGGDAPDTTGRLRWAEERMAALEADLGGLRGAGTLGPRRAVPLTRAERLRAQPASTWWLLAAAVLIVAAIITAVV